MEKEKGYLMIVAVLLIIVAIVSFNFGKMSGQATKEAVESEEQIHVGGITEVAGEEQAVLEETTKTQAEETEEIIEETPGTTG